VGKWLSAHLADHGDEVFSIDESVDVRDEAALREVLRAAVPEVIYHLAALTHVGRSFEDPISYLEVNTVGTYKLLEAARSLVELPKVILISSAEVYGLTCQNKDGDPITEEDPVLPATPYAFSKVAAEYGGLQQMYSYGLPVVLARPFNHIGPGQSDAFVVSALAKRIAAAEISGEKYIPVGNLAAKRDFTDVRDVVAAYRMMAVEAKAGEAYNICSGKAVAISEIAEDLIRISASDIELRRDESLLRPVDLPVLYGSPAKLQDVTSWEPVIPRDQTLSDVLTYWREHLS
jgi:GDP-4-dehydro-6-deoxy-D-mannose reductase